MIIMACYGTKFVNKTNVAAFLFEFVEFTFYLLSHSHDKRHRAVTSLMLLDNARDVIIFCRHSERIMN
jgi:hypothetical protein